MTPTVTRPRRGLAAALWIGAFVAIAALLALVAGSPRQTDAVLDPQNPNPSGAQAAARVLAAEGVAVSVVRGRADLESRAPGEGATVVIGASPQLTVTATDLAIEAAAGADRIVVLAPAPAVAQRLGLQPTRGAATGKPVRAACTGIDLPSDLTVTPGEQRLVSPAAGAGRCFGTAEDGAYLVRLPGFEGRPEIWVLSTPELLDNAHLAQEGNAAVALRVLGSSRSLLWYEAAAGDTPPGADSEETLQDLLPRWLGYVLALVVSAVLVTMVWRGRRLGRLVREPLPVLIRAGELTQARARLYRKARDLPRAARALQLGTRRRLAARFGLPASAQPYQLLPEVAAATGRPVAELEHELFTRVPHSEGELQALADRLSTIEEEVRGR